MADRFPSPFDTPTPEGAEGWQELYAYSSLFSEDRREYEESMFWFQDGVHWPAVLTPWDATFFEYAIVSLSQYNTRHLLVPPANGIDYRILNGYAYLTPVPAPEADIPARVEAFTQRAGFYFVNWNDLYDKWMVKIRDLVGEMEAVKLDALPDVEDFDAVVASGRGLGSGYDLVEGYHRILDSALKLWNYHFEFLNLGYAAYLDFFGFCKGVFPNIPDLAIAKMVAGVEVDLFRPDEELKRLAHMARNSGVSAAFDAGKRRRHLRGPQGQRLGQGMDRLVPGGRRTVVQLLDRVGFLPHGQDLDRARRDPLRVHPQLHLQARQR